MKQFLTNTLLRWVFIATIIAIGAFFGGVMGGIILSDDAKIAPVSVTVMAVPEHEAMVLAFIYDEMGIASTEVEIATTTELVEMVESIISSELNIVVTITPVLRAQLINPIQRSQYRQYDKRGYQLQPAVQRRTVMTIGDNARFVDTIGLTRLRQ